MNRVLITVGVLVVLVGAGTAVWWFRFRKKKDEKGKDEDEDEKDDDPVTGGGGTTGGEEEEEEETPKEGEEEEETPKEGEEEEETPKEEEEEETPKEEEEEEITEDMCFIKLIDIESNIEDLQYLLHDIDTDMKGVSGDVEKVQNVDVNALKKIRHVPGKYYNNHDSKMHVKERERIQFDTYLHMENNPEIHLNDMLLAKPVKMSSDYTQLLVYDPVEEGTVTFAF